MLVAEIPHLLQEILVSVVVAQPDMELLGWRGQDETLPDAVTRLRPDVLVLGTERKLDTEDVAQLLARHPRMRLLAVSGDGRSTMMYELRPHEIEVGNVSPQGLVDVLRVSTVGVS